MHDVGGALTSLYDRLFVQEVSLDEFKVVELLSESCPQRTDFSLVCLRSDGASDGERAVFQEKLANLGSNVSRNSSDDD